MILTRHGLRPATLAILLLGLIPADLPAKAPAVRELRTQKVGDATFFHVRFEVPADLSLPQWDRLPWTDARRTALARLPGLVPQDGKTQAVYGRLNQPRLFLFNPAPPTAVPDLEFVGKVSGQGSAAFLLLYPTREEVKDKDGKTRMRRSWAELPVVLDFDKATNVDVPAEARKRRPEEPARKDNPNGAAPARPEPSGNDLEGLWAVGQAQHFAVLEAQAPEFGFFSFAREATGRKYGVPSPAIFGGGQAFTRRDFLDTQLYETTTGAAAIAESLQLHRLLNSNFRDTGERTIDIAKVPGIDIAEHPWEKMMAGKKPSPEPLARLVPSDNYYLHFKNIAKFIELGELLDLWGTNLTRAYEVTSRDQQFKQRLERQLCLKSGWLGKTFGPTVVKSLALTGSDAYLREGSDVTVIFHVVNRPLFLGAVDQFLQEARKEFKDQLKESKEEYQKITIEKFVTPLREVSLHRASFGDYVVYSNSSAGLRRILDTHQGRHKALADSLDFQYMRTVFRLEDEQEDGFAFLSDPFIRQLVGPAGKIKEKRRLEALTSLYMETHGALFTAWETGKLPDDHKLLLATSTLKLEEIYLPDGKEILWHQGRNVAVSDTYNTIHFATPLIELPIDKITPNEERDYLRFRAEYLGLWRGFFDPIGMRFSLRDKQVRVETYILPLIQNSQYNQLRQRTGDGTTNLDPATISPKTLVQFLTHISPNAPERGMGADALRGLGMLGRAKGLDFLGDWFLVRLDDSPVYGQLAELALRRELDPDAQPEGRGRDEDVIEAAQLFFQVPLTIGVSIKNPLVFAGILAAARTQIMNVLPGGLEWEPMEPAYKDVSIVRIRPKANGEIARYFKKGPLPALYYALVDGGWYLSLREEPLKELIERSVAKREGKEPKGEAVAINSSLYVAPGAADLAGVFLRRYLEIETQRRALGNAPLWHTLYRTGAVTATADDKTLRAVAFNLLGFIPVSPDDAPYRFDKKTDEVVNARHGSLRKPELHAGVEKDSPLGQLLEQFRTLRTDLRFREDGVHTVLTIERKAKK